MKTIKIGVIVIAFLLVAQWALERREHALICGLLVETVDRFKTEVGSYPKSAKELVAYGYLSNIDFADGCDVFPLK
jgi:hypothetical protein